MTSAFSWQNSISLCPATFCTPRPNFACYSRCFLTSYFCIPVPYNEKGIFWECYFQKVLQIFIEPFTSASSALLFGAQTWITVILNDLPWKQQRSSDCLCDSCLSSRHQSRSSSQALLSFSLYTLCLDHLGWAPIPQIPISESFICSFICFMI